MFYKALAVIVFLTALAISLLFHRQQKFETMHDMAGLHRHINRTRRSLWDMQTRIAGQTHPQKLQQKIDDLNLQLEPAMPKHRNAGPNAADPSLALAPVSPSANRP